MPWPMGIFIFLAGGGGVLRTVYALFFESKYPDGVQDDMTQLSNPGLHSLHIDHRKLQGGESTAYIPASPARVGGWLETSDLEPHNFIDNTTKLLEKEEN